MIPISVYAVSPRLGPAFVWHLVRATSTPPVPISKPVGSPPCDTPPLVGPPIPPLSRRWRSGSKPWLPPTSHQPHLYQTTALHPHPPLTQPDTIPVISHHHLLYHPPLPHIQPPSYHPYPNSAVVPACALSPPQPPPSSPPPVYLPVPSDLNLDRAGKSLTTFSSATRGPHGKEWAFVDEQELIKTPTYLKRVVREKLNEVNRLRKRRVITM
jgi:hypothetical protein